jgi:polyhydroxyalkanoate synthesis regulator phasin
MIKLVKLIKEVNESGHISTEDMTYFKEQIETVLNSIDDLHQEIGSNLEQAYDGTGFDVYKQMEAQTSRYFEASKKSLQYLDKYMDKMSKRVTSLQPEVPTTRPAQGI